MTYNDELRVALHAVQKASKLCTSVQFKLIDSDTLEKKDRSPVTIADYGSQAVISSILAADFPNDPLVGEEDSAELEQNDNMRSKVYDLVKEQVPDDDDPIWSTPDFYRSLTEEYETLSKQIPD